MSISIVSRRLNLNGVPPSTKADLRARYRRFQRHLCSPPPALTPDVSEELVLPISPEQSTRLKGAIGLQDSGRKTVHAQFQAEKSLLILQLRPAPPARIRLLSSNQVAQMLGVSRWTIYRYARQGKFQTYRLGRLLRFELDDVLGCLSARRI